MALDAVLGTTPASDLPSLTTDHPVSPMSWKVPEPPISDYWTGLFLLALVVLVTGGLTYWLLG